jgi:hypothetical protein
VGQEKQLGEIVASIVPVVLGEPEVEQAVLVLVLSEPPTVRLEPVLEPG